MKTEAEIADELFNKELDCCLKIGSVTLVDHGGPVTTDTIKRPNRYDVSYGPGDQASIDYHFCREFGGPGDRACFGTNPDHGYTFEEAKERVAAYYEAQVAYWRDMTEAQWANP